MNAEHNTTRELHWCLACYYHVLVDGEVVGTIWTEGHYQDLQRDLLGRFDVVDLPSRRHAMVLRRAVTFDRKVDSVVVAGTLKKPMAKKPDWLQAVWIEAGHTFGGDHQKAA
ncbi:hypothetical protein [Pseudomonas pseudonitroreducens]|uniref:hypothetical protein n=1 Tax=Pseudomonas pseudonitroreducens TaxID=2892326 RepID=UPI001F197E5A|nr:hypothetical protein [Pseudomonas pseudonitroreducens]